MVQKLGHLTTSWDKMDPKIIEWEEGWEVVQNAIARLKRIMEGGVQLQPFTSEEYMMFYETIYRMCRQDPPHDYSQQLYDKYKDTFVDHIGSTILPAIRVKHGEPMLREVATTWSEHKVMTFWLFRFFHYLNRGFVSRKSLPPLEEVALSCFRDMVYKDVNNEATGVVIELINKEREGELIDQELLKNVLNIYVEIARGSLECYQQDFEDDFLEDTGAYYSRKASSWILEDSCPDYMLKIEDCLRKERERASRFLHSSTEPKLVMKVQDKLLVVHAKELLEKERSGCNALLKGDKVDDLARMYRLYHEIPNGLEPIARIFKQHIFEQCTILIKQTEDAVSDQDPGRNITELQDKYKALVRDCFENHPLFEKALEMACEILADEAIPWSATTF